MKKIKNPVTVLDHLTNRMIDDHNMKEKEQPKDESKEDEFIELDVPIKTPLWEDDESKEVKEGGELFTGGEWVRRGWEIIGHYGSNKHICEITGNFMDRPEAEANAALIAASKDMYLALKAAVSDYKFDGIISEETAKQIRLALKKANPNY